MVSWCEKHIFRGYQSIEFESLTFSTCLLKKNKLLIQNDIVIQLKIGQKRIVYWELIKSLNFSLNFLIGEHWKIYFFSGIMKEKR
jgi:hypothetical protein